MKKTIPAWMNRLVRRRSGDACEYCRLPQWCEDAAFHIDHIEPRKKGGKTLPENLALAWVKCSLKKAARTHARDPQSNSAAPLFHPRVDVWTDHFHWTRTWKLIGLTATGRATVIALGLNRPTLLRIRRIWGHARQISPKFDSRLAAGPVRNASPTILPLFR